LAENLGHCGAMSQLQVTRWRRRLLWSVVVAIPLGFLALFFLWPVFSLVATGLLGGSASFAPLKSAHTWSVVAQTLAQGISGSLVSVVLGIPTAFVLYRLRFRGVALCRGLMTVPFVLPTVVVAVAFAALVGRGGPLAFLGLEDSFITIVAALAFFNVTLVARMVGSLWSQLDPRLEQAARTLGASPARVFLTITLPSLAPAIASAAALVFLFCSTSFGIILILGGREFSNLETEIYRQTVQIFDLPQASLLSLIQMVIVLIALVLSQRTRKAPLGMTRAERPPRKHDLPVIAFVSLAALALQLMPIVALVRQSFTSSAGAFTLQHYRELSAVVQGVNVSALHAAWTSLGMALVSTVFTMAVAGAVAVVVSRTPRTRLLKRAISLFDGAMMLPIGISAVTLGFGLLLTMHKPLGIGIDLRTSAVLIPIAQSLVALPIVLRTLIPVFRSIDPKLKDAATMLGASEWTVLRTVELPMVGRAVGIALGFAFATSLGEFGATAFLVRPDVQTLPVVIAQLTARPGGYGAALAASVLLGVITALVMVIAERARKDWAGEL
jgi:thiamine transport system permease protein